MENSRQCEKDDILVNFRDMLLYVLTRWKSIVLCTVALTVLLPGLRFALDWRAYAQKKNTHESAPVELTDEEMADVVTMINYRRNCEAQIRDNRQSLLMQIDASKTAARVLSFFIKGSNAPIAAAWYQNNFDAESLIQVVDLGKWPTANERYVAELITLSAVNAGEAADTSLLMVKIVAPDEDLCNDLSEETANRIMGMVPELRKELGAVTVTAAGNVFSRGTDASVKNAQQANLTNLKNVQNNIAALQETLSAKQNAYLETVFADENQPILPKPAISKKYLVVGFAGGLFLPIFVLVLGYLLSKTVKSPEDAAERLDLYLLGTLCSPQAKPIPRWLSGLVPAVAEDDAVWVRQAVLRAQRTIPEDGNRTVALVEDIPLEESRQKALKTALKKAGFALNVCDDPGRNAAALEALSACGGAILTATVGKTAYPDLYERALLSRSLGATPLGIVAQCGKK